MVTKTYRGESHLTHLEKENEALRNENAVLREMVRLAGRYGELQVEIAQALDADESARRAA